MSVESRKSPQETRVLVVEDETRLREMLVTAINEMGFVAAGAKSGEDAIRTMERQPHEIALLDLNLPGISGQELFERLHDRWPNTRVIILTGYGDLDAARLAIRLDVVDFLSKPASLGEIEVALDRAHRRPPRTPDTRPTEPNLTVRDVEESTHPRPFHPSTTFQDVERRQILETLARNNGNRSATAEELDISVRTLYYRLAEFQRQGYLP